MYILNLSSHEVVKCSKDEVWGAFSIATNNQTCMQEDAYRYFLNMLYQNKVLITYVGQQEVSKAVIDKLFNEVSRYFDIAWFDTMEDMQDWVKDYNLEAPEKYQINLKF